MARSATSRRPANRRIGRLDRSADRDVPLDSATPTPPTGSAPGDGAALPTAPPTEDQTQAMSTGNDPWAALPESDRQRLGRQFSRLLLLAVRLANHTPEQEVF